MTLLQMSMVIMLLLCLTVILFIGARAWKRGSDRAGCILNIQNVQKGVRSYSNIYALSEGAVVPQLKSRIVEFGFLETIPSCPTRGEYRFGTYSPESGSDMVPPVGALYMVCSLAESDRHAPESHADW